MNKIKFAVISAFVLAGLILLSCVGQREPSDSVPVPGPVSWYAIEEVSPNVLRITALKGVKVDYYLEIYNGEFQLSWNRSFGKALSLGLAEVEKTYTVKDIIALAGNNGQEIIVRVEGKKEKRQ